VSLGASSRKKEENVEGREQTTGRRDTETEKDVSSTFLKRRKIIHR
jgi:hypothetical protein